MAIEKPKSNPNITPLEISSDTNRVVLRELTPDDDDKYHALVHKNKTHLEQGGLKLADMYESPEDIAAAREVAAATEGLHRFGVWKNGQLVGGLDLTPADEEGTAEVSFFVDYYKTTEGIGRQAVKNALEYLDSMGHDAVAQVRPGHTSSSKLLEGQGFRLIGNSTGNAEYKRAAQKPRS